MANKSNSMGTIVITALVTALVVGGGVYYLQKNTEQEKQVEQPKRVEEAPSVVPRVKAPTVDKSLVEYYKNRQSSFNKVLSNASVENGSQSGLKEIAKVKIACPKDADGPCGGDLLIMSKTTLHAGSQEFYLAQEGGAGFDYFGPFTDDLTRLVNESKTIGSITESN